MTGGAPAPGTPAVGIVDLPAQALAVIREHSCFPAFMKFIGPHLGEAFAYAKSRPDIRTNGRMIIVYRNETMKFHDPEGIDLEFGTQVENAFEGNGRVVCSVLPACRSVHATHVGPYDRMGETHEAIWKWAHARGLRLTGLNWELYDHPTDDPALLRTDVYHRIG